MKSNEHPKWCKWQIFQSLDKIKNVENYGKWDVLKSMINYWNGKLRAKNMANDSTNSIDIELFFLFELEITRIDKWIVKKGRGIWKNFYATKAVWKSNCESEWNDFSLSLRRLLPFLLPSPLNCYTLHGGDCWEHDSSIMYSYVESFYAWIVGRFAVIKRKSQMSQVLFSTFHSYHGHRTVHTKFFFAFFSFLLFFFPLFLLLLSISRC